MIWALLLAACSGDKSVEDSAVPYISEETEFDKPAFDADAVADALNDALLSLRDLNGGPLADAYDAAMAGADDDCPTVYSGADGDYWYDTCTSDDGSSFDGYAALTELDNYAYSEGGTAWTGFSLYGLASIKTPDGRAFVANGSAARLVADHGAWAEYYTVVDGTFSWDGDEADGTWLSEGPLPAFTMYAYDVPSSAARVITLTGSVSGFEGLASTVVFQDLALATETSGFPCALEPSGTLSYRDQDGRWVDLLWDLPYDTATGELGDMDPADCDGCASTWVDGEYLGQTCLDWPALLEWDGDAPWN